MPNNLESRIGKVYPQNPAHEEIAWAASLIRRGGVVGYPTETFYGLGAQPAQEKAIERIYTIKGRDFRKPLPLIASDMKAVLRAVAEWPRVADRLTRAFWPGPLTLVFKASPDLPPLLHANTGKIAIRISSHPVAHELADAVGGLLTATSANQADEPACKDPDEMIVSFLSRLDGLLHAGRLSSHLPSTIVDISEAPREPIQLLRAGCIPWKDIVEIA